MAATSSSDELAQLSDLIAEQVPGADARAKADGRKISATWIGQGDHLILLVVNATSVKKVKRTFYRCRVLDVVVEEA